MATSDERAPPPLTTDVLRPESKLRPVRQDAQVVAIHVEPPADLVLVQLVEEQPLQEIALLGGKPGHHLAYVRLLFGRGQRGFRACTLVSQLDVGVLVER